MSLQHLLLTMLNTSCQQAEEKCSWDPAPLSQARQWQELRGKKKKKKCDWHRCNLLMMHIYSGNWKNIIPLLCNGRQCWDQRQFPISKLTNTETKQNDLAVCCRISLLPGTHYEQPNMLPTRSNSLLTKTYFDSLTSWYPPIQKLQLSKNSVNSNQFPTLQGAS